MVVETVAESLKHTGVHSDLYTAVPDGGQTEIFLTVGFPEELAGVLSLCKDGVLGNVDTGGFFKEVVAEFYFIDAGAHRHGEQADGRRYFNKIFHVVLCFF